MDRINKKEELLQRGMQEAREGDLKKAIKLLKHLDRIDPNDIENKLRLGAVYHQANEERSALEALEIYVKKKPNALFAFQLMGRVFYKLKKYDDSLIAFNKEIENNPEYAEAYSDRAYVLNELNRFDKALDSASKAIGLDQNLPEAFDCMAIAHNALGHFNDAKKYVFKAIELDRSNPDFIRTLADIHFDQGNSVEALEIYDIVLKHYPKNSHCIVQKSILLLQMTKFEEGWQLYEERHFISEKKSLYQQFSDNDFIKHPHMLIKKEQGIGDMVLFMSTLSELDQEEQVARDKEIIVEIDQRLVSIFERSFKHLKFITSTKLLDNKKLYKTFGMASLGGYLRKHISLFKNQKQQFLSSDINKKKSYRDYLDSLKSNKEIKICGISWRSQNPKLGFFKSIELIKLKSILSLENILFVNLQYDCSSQEIIEIKQKYGFDIINFPDIDLLNDIDSVCSLISACDMILTTSNINVHLAGALGKNVFLLVPKGKGRHFYWHHEYKKSLWYPSVTIFDQDEPGDWAIPIDQVLKELSLK